MARPGSQQIAGYYPTPLSLLPSIAALLRFPADHATAHLLDPCAGDGTAIRTLRDLWAESRPLLDDDWPVSSRLSITAAELEEARATALAEALDETHYTHGDRAFHADAFRLYPEMPASTGATVLFLNPPYDHDPEHRRLEHRFLLRFTAHLHPGAGVLLYLVPHYALEPSADFLARHYLDLRAYRFPDPEYQAFRQVVLLGRRTRRPLTSSTFAAVGAAGTGDRQFEKQAGDAGDREAGMQGCSRRRAGREDGTGGCRLDAEASTSTETRRPGMASPRRQRLVALVC